MAQAGEAPDIAEISSGALGTYVEMGVAIDISKYMSAWLTMMPTLWSICPWKAPFTACPCT